MVKLKIGAKVNTLIIITVLLVGGVSLILSVTALKKEARFAIENYTSAMMEEKKSQIKNLVNTAYTIAEERLAASQNTETIREEYGNDVKAVVEQAISVFEAANEDGTIEDIEMRKNAAKKIIEKMRWGYENKGYFWIQDTDGKMVLHPIKPSLNGQDLFGIKDPDGKLLFKEMDDTAKKDGAGFVDYKWPKPGSDEPVDKISYIKLFEPWGWIIGGGVYLESTEDLLKLSALNTIGSIRYGKDGSGYFFIYDSKGNCILHPIRPQNVGKNYIDLKDKKDNFIIQDMLKAAASNDQGNYFKYYYPKPGMEEPLPKQSFARKVKAWDWNIGTGIYTDDVDAVVLKQSQVIKKNINSEIIKLLLISILIALIALFVSYLVIAKGVVAPIRKVIDMLKDIAQGEGDLTRRIEDNSGDETQELAENFNQFIENIQTMIAKIKQDSIVLNDSAEMLADVSDGMNHASQNTADRANTVAAAAEQMSANMNSISAATEQSSTNISMVSSAAEEMTSTIDEIAQNAEQARSITTNAVNQTDEASKKVDTLGQSADEIYRVVEAITDISEQVNLLALNATIEAARAGEAGKGFAVVANEIKTLAVQTSDASDQIKQKVKDIQTSTQGTVKQISSITSVVGEIDQIVSTIAAAVEQQSATTKEIAQNVSQASLGLGEVNENVSQGSVTAQEVAKEVAQVSASSEEMTQSSLQVKEKANGLSDLSKTLSDMMGKFKV